MKIVCIVQSRMGSTRLPGKASMMLQGKSMTWHVLNRVRQAKLIDEVVLALPIEPIHNGVLATAARDLGIEPVWTKGDPNDLLKRYTIAAHHYRADLIVRVPGDNPCVDPDEIDRIIDYATSERMPHHWLVSNLDKNINGNGYPGGLGAEVYTLEFLEWLERKRKSPELREHPHKWAFLNNRVKTIQCPESIRRPDLRFDVNEPEDFDFTADIYDHFQGGMFKSKELIEYVSRKGANRSWQITHEIWDNKSQGASPASTSF